MFPSGFDDGLPLGNQTNCAQTMDCTRETCHALADFYKTAEQTADDAIEDQSSHSQQTRFILPNQDSSTCQTKTLRQSQTLMISLTKGVRIILLICLLHLENRQCDDFRRTTTGHMT
jgi:hypothetical protein